ncbi:MAG TPA: AAA family ATPase [Longimicrobium sp.]|nr:AAA family ATPase [Longimicrobium sp.]
MLHAGEAPHGHGVGLVEEEDGVLLFDEADAIASRRFTSMDQGYQREANAVVNVLLRALESFSGVVIFATNLAANFDPAFERRIRTHILFEMPGPDERERIWRAQLHARKTPLAPDVDFRALAAAYPASGGDIKNAVLKAAQMTIAEPGPDDEKRIAHRHFAAGIEEVLAAKRVMDQSLFGGGAAAAGLAALAADGRQGVDDEMSALASRLVEVEDALVPVPGAVQRVEAGQAELRRRMDDLHAALQARPDAAAELARQLEVSLGGRLRAVLAVAGAALVLALARLAAAVL